MLLYGLNLSWGAMMIDGKYRRIIATFINEETAQTFCEIAKQEWAEDFTPIQLDDFEKEYCEPIQGHMYKQNYQKGGR